MANQKAVAMFFSGALFRRSMPFQFEESNEPFLELFTAHGKLFTDELLLGDLSEAPPVVKETLEKDFPGYELKKAELIANPNGVGEEYEIYLVVGGVNWKLSVNEKGKIEGKDRF